MGLFSRKSMVDEWMESVDEFYKKVKKTKKKFLKGEKIDDDNVIKILYGGLYFGTFLRHYLITPRYGYPARKHVPDLRALSQEIDNIYSLVLEFHNDVFIKRLEFWIDKAQDSRTKKDYEKILKKLKLERGWDKKAGKMYDELIKMREENPSMRVVVEAFGPLVRDFIAPVTARQTPSFQQEVNRTLEQFLEISEACVKQVAGSQDTSIESKISSKDKVVDATFLASGIILLAVGLGIFNVGLSFAYKAVKFIMSHNEKQNEIFYEEIMEKFVQIIQIFKAVFAQMKFFEHAYAEQNNEFYLKGQSEKVFETWEEIRLASKTMEKMKMEIKDKLIKKRIQEVKQDFEKKMGEGAVSADLVQEIDQISRQETAVRNMYNTQRPGAYA